MRLSSFRSRSLLAGCLASALLLVPAGAGAQAASAPPSDNPLVLTYDSPRTGVVTPAATAGTLDGPGYSVWTYPDGSVMRWDSCTPIHYRVNSTYAPTGARAELTQAISTLSADSGLTFVNDGDSAEIPQNGYGTSTTAAGRPPLLIAWATPGAGVGGSDLLPPLPVVGIGGPVSAAWTSADGTYNPYRIVSGEVVLNKDANLTPGFGPGVQSSRGQLLLHELGHAVGLAHTNDTVEVMYPTLHTSTTTDYAAGDKAGLTRVGAPAGCIGAPTATPPVTVGSPAPNPWLDFWNWLVALFLSWFH